MGSSVAFRQTLSLRRVRKGLGCGLVVGPGCSVLRFREQGFMA